MPVEGCADAVEAEAETMPTNQLPKAPALALVTTGPVFLVGAVIHPHAPHAHTMAEVA